MPLTGIGGSHSDLFSSLCDRMGNGRTQDACQSQLVQRWQNNNGAIVTDDNSQNHMVDADMKDPYPGILLGLRISQKHKN